MLQIGSRALQKFFKHRKCIDYDYVATEDEAMNFVSGMNWKRVKNKIIVNGRPRPIEGEDIIEIDLALPGTSDEMLLNIAKDLEPTSKEFLNLLYMIKLSHRYKKNSHHFLKTMSDIHLMRRLGAEFETKHSEFYKLRESESYWYKHPSLKQNKDDFFKDTIYIYDHDTIHEAVKHLERPAYTYYIKDGCEVECDVNKFNNLPQEVKDFGVLEEAYVLALERSQIPNVINPEAYQNRKINLNPRLSFKIALEKVCTSITSGWFREYGWENFYRINKLYSSEYVTKFTEALESGKIAPFTGSKY